jgi:hypothetical protein
VPPGRDRFRYPDSQDDGETCDEKVSRRPEYTAGIKRTAQVDHRHSSQYREAQEKRVGVERG